MTGTMSDQDVRSDADNVELAVEYLRMCADADNAAIVAGELAANPDVAQRLRDIIATAEQALSATGQRIENPTRPVIVKSGHHRPEHIPWMRGPG